MNSPLAGVDATNRRPIALACVPVPLLPEGLLLVGAGDLSLPTPQVRVQEAVDGTADAGLKQQDVSRQDHSGGVQREPSGAGVVSAERLEDGGRNRHAGIGGG